MIDNIESIIKQFLLLNDIEKRQVSYLIETLNSRRESEKCIIIESLGLEHLFQPTLLRYKLRPFS